MAPYHNPRSGEEAPFVTISPFASTDTLFPGTAGDLELFTDKEVIALSNVGVLKSTITGTSTSKLPLLASQMKPDSSTRKRDHRDSPSHRHPVTAATGSCEDLGKSEHELEAARKQLHRQIDAKCGHPKSRDLTHGRITGDKRGPTLKCGRSVGTGASGERPRPKERYAERGRSTNVDT